MNNSFRIAAVVVTYNRKKLLEENIRCLMLQDMALDDIIIIDNHSMDGTQEHIQTIFSTDSIHINYHYMKRNLCGAGGFEYGAKIAYDMGFDLIWMMDDDGRPMDNSTLSKLVEVVKKRGLQRSPFILNSLVLCNNENLSFKLGSAQSRQQINAMSENDLITSTESPMINPFNGTLVSRELFQLIGFPNGKFVIYGDETDFAYRAIDAHAFVATVTTSLYYHPRHSNFVEFCGKKFTTIQSGKWRYYYCTRNNIYRLKCRKKYLGCIKSCLNVIIGIIYADDKKSISLHYAIRGMIDGFQGKLGLIVEPQKDK